MAFVLGAVDADERLERYAGLDLVDLVRLNLSLVAGERVLRALLRRFGSLAAALRAPAAVLEKVRGVGTSRAEAIAATRRADAEAELLRAEALGVRVVALGAAGYPPLLAAIDDPPIVLYVRGALDPDEPCAALVGSRRATAYGLRTARSLAKGLAGAGVAVVSGLARGVDAAAHRSALEAGGRTIAVLGCGIDCCYPPEHAELMAACASQGAVLSEFPLGTPPLGPYFPRRNRIVAGLCRAVCVVEAAERSGSLITASWALEQGREVLAIPHRIDDPGATGALRLLQDGAQPAMGAACVLAAAGLAPAPQPGASAGAADGDGRPALPPGLSAAATAVLGHLTRDPQTLDQLIDAAGLAPTAAFAALLELTRRSIARPGPGRTYALV